jgi:5-methylcytosine-specific restriction endonuclease McrA
MSVDYQECLCGRGYFNPEHYSACYTCYLERRECYLECIWCGRWHSPEYSSCYRCRRADPYRDEAARDLRLDILIRDDFTCRDCGSHDMPQVDHIKPCAEGGQAKPWNLQVLCRACNLDKGRYWQPGSHWDDTRVELMHLYFTFGWSLLDGDERTQLVSDAGIYSDEFTWHARFGLNRTSGQNDRSYSLSELSGPPDWAVAMADTFLPEPESVAA